MTRVSMLAVTLVLLVRAVSVDAADNAPPSATTNNVAYFIERNGGRVVEAPHEVLGSEPSRISWIRREIASERCSTSSLSRNNPVPEN
jgi:hypothetical protein